MSFWNGIPRERVRQGDIYKSPEEMDIHDEDLPRRSFIKINGALVPVSSVEVVVDPQTGRPYERVVVEQIYDASGMRVSPAEIAGTSWTGLDVPAHAALTCMNPWGLHTRWLCFDGIDGFLTPLDPFAENGGVNPLCNVCFERNERNRFWRWITVGLWNPTIF